MAGSEAFTNKSVNGLTITSTTGTLTLANSSSLITSGGHSLTLTTSGSTNVTLPTTGTLSTLAGTEVFTNKSLTGGTAQIGTSGTTGGLGCSTYKDLTTVDNTAGVLTDAYSHSVTGNTFAVDGDTICFFSAGSFAATANVDKQIKVIFDGTTIFDTGLIAVTAANDWVIEGVIMRTSATVIKCFVKYNSSFATLASFADYVSVTVANLTSNRTLKLQVGGTGAADTSAKFYKEIWYSA